MESRRSGPRTSRAVRGPGSDGALVVSSSVPGSLSNELVIKF
jgi:hypothetical protein